MPSKKNQSLLLINVAAFFIVMAGVKYASPLFESLLMSFFIAINLSQPIAWLRSKKVPKGIAITSIFLLIVVIIGAFGQVISSSFASFSTDLPKYQSNINEMTSSLQVTLQENGIQVTRNEFLEAFNPNKVMATMSNFLSDLGGVMGNAFTIIFLTLFLLMEFETIPIKLNAIAKRNESFGYLEGIGKSIRHYLSIKTITSALTGLLIWIFLRILGVDYAVIWAIIAFALNYIPNIGSIMAAIPAVLFALLQLGFGGFIWTTIIFVVVNMVIGNVVEPNLMGKGLGLSTFIVFLSLIFWGFIFGTVGMFLSVPLTMAFKIIFEQRPETKWAAILLGTEDDVAKLNQNEKNLDE